MSVMTPCATRFVSVSVLLLLLFFCSWLMSCTEPVLGVRMRALWQEVQQMHPLATFAHAMEHGGTGEVAPYFFTPIHNTHYTRNCTEMQRLRNESRHVPQRTVTTCHHARVICQHGVIHTYQAGQRLTHSSPRYRDGYHSRLQHCSFCLSLTAIKPPLHECHRPSPWTPETHRQPFRYPLCRRLPSTNRVARCHNHPAHALV